MSASSISAARAALFALLTTARTDNTSSLYRVQIAWGNPTSYEEQEVVCLRGISSPSEQPADIGNFAHQEQYQIELAVKAHNPSGNAGTVDARAYALADGVRQVVNRNPTLSATVQWSYVASQRGGETQPAQSGGHFCLIDLSVFCRAMPTT